MQCIHTFLQLRGKDLESHTPRSTDDDARERPHPTPPRGWPWLPVSHPAQSRWSELFNLRLRELKDEQPSEPTAVVALLSSIPMPEAVRTFPLEFWCGKNIVPLARSNETLTLAVSDASARMFDIDEVKFQTGLDVTTILAPLLEVMAALDALRHWDTDIAPLLT